MRLVALVFFSFLMLARSVPAQVAGGAISGTVTDPQGVAISNAQIEIENPARNETRRLATNEVGLYTIPNLSPGTYQIKFSAPGFATVAQSNVDVKVGSELVVNVQLKLGSTQQTIEVTATPPAVDAASSSIQAVVDAKTVRELPLNGRDWTSLAALEPGVSVVRTQNSAASLTINRTNRGLGTQMTINGNRPQQNNYRLDGVSVNDQFGGSPGSSLGQTIGVDAVQEFSVVTTNAPSDYGKNGGAVVNAVTRSGTNQIHGSAYEFLRNSALDARNFFDSTPSPPPFKRNQFGGSLSGPILRNRTYFFVDYEGLREGLGTSNVISVPSAAARSGHLASGKTVTVNPRASAYLNAFYPLPNGPTSGDIATYSFSTPLISNENFVTARLDHHFSEKDDLHGIFLWDNSQTTGPDAYGVVDLGIVSQRRTAALEESHTLSPEMINVARAGFNRSISSALAPIGAIVPAAADTSFGFVPGRAVGSILIGGVTTFNGGLGAAGEYIYHYNSFQYSDDVFWTKHSHALKMGVAFERDQTNAVPGGTPSGSVSFSSLTNFLTDIPQSFTSNIPGTGGEVGYRQSVFGSYLQDDWHLRPNLTINLGLRYEISSVPTEEHDRLTSLVNLNAPQLHLGSPLFHNPTLRNFSPRVGFAWDPFKTGKTAIRAGFGQYDVLPLVYEYLLSSLLSAPYLEQGSIATLPAGAFPNGLYGTLTPSSFRTQWIEQDPRRSYVLEWNFNIQRDLGKDTVVQAGYTGSHGVHLTFTTSNANIVQPIATQQGYVWPSNGQLVNPNFGTITPTLWQVSSSYEALQTRISRNLRHGLHIEASYTWGKSLDTNSEASTTAFANSLTNLPEFDPRVRRGLSDFDVRHNFIANALWEIPAPRTGSGFVNWLGRGWELGDILQLSSGLPFTPLISGDPLNSKLTTFNFDEPDRLSMPQCNNPVNSGNPSQYINLSCFVAPSPANRLGDAGRNIIIGPGLVNLDQAFYKNNRVNWFSEEFNIQFRAELFNILNHTNFAPPNATNVLIFQTTGTGAATAISPIPSSGALTSTATTSRQIQFAVKIIW